MGFLRRLLGGSEGPQPDDAGPIDPAEAEASEREYERELLKAEQERLDELTQRQLRYADYAWQPPAEGGERRADDRDETAGNR
jgi:hypothetical protein